MATPILATKLHIPQAHPDLVPRSRLIKRLAQGLDSGSKLTLITAPAGFGKTTLVSDWVGQMADSSTPVYHFGWLSLDEDDNDFVRFLTYFISALQQLDPEIGQSVQSMLRLPQPPPLETAMTALINEIAAAFTGTRCVFIFDDYHLIEADPINVALTFLLDHLPPQIHLVITTRDDPHLPLARLRVQGQLTELRAADLRFTIAEATEFLNRTMGLDLSVEDITALENRTEGWIAGLQLAAISMQKHDDATRFIKSFTGTHRFILDYLIEEVVEQQPKNVQSFLLQTAVLNRLTGSLCDALTGQNNGQATLKMLERANLFIVPLDEEWRWYRYHHLFADLLRQRLRQTNPELAPNLHRRASEWFEKNGLVNEAVEHALHAGDFEWMAQLIDEHGEAVWERGEHTELRRWLAELPVELLHSRPLLCVFRGWYLLAAGQQEAADRILQAAQLALAPVPESANDPAQPDRDRHDDVDRPALRGKVATALAFLAFYRGDVAGIVHYARQALEYLPRQEISWRSTATHVLGDAYDFQGQIDAAYHSRLGAFEASKSTGNNFLMMIAGMKLAIILRQQGRLQQVDEICSQQLQRAQDSGLAQTSVTGWLLAIWGEMRAEINDLDGAIAQAKQGVELVERGGDLAMLGWSYLCLMRVLFSRGDLTGVEEIVHKLEMTAHESFVPPWIMNLKAAWQARIWLAQKKLTVASQWVEDRRLDPSDDVTYLREAETIVLARILIAQGQFDGAGTLFQRLLRAAEAGGRTSRMIEILALQALLFHAQADTDRAATTLGQALTLAQPGGFVRIFVDEGQPMADLLARMTGDDRRMSDYIRKLLAAFGTQQGVQPSGVTSQPLVEPLSERELEVLLLVAEGLTNQEISSRLFLSLNTVKVHNHNIYSKLGVHSRTRAVARARALGILPPV